MVKSAERVMQILNIIGSAKDGLKHSEIAKGLKIPKGSLTFLLNDLVTEDFLKLTSDSKYKLGPQILILANTYLTSLDIVDLGKPILQKLVKETNEAAAIGVPVGENIIIVAKQDSTQHLKLEYELGEYFPIYAAATGKVILAFTGQEFIEKYISSVQMEPITIHTITNKEALRQELEKIQKEKVAVAAEELFTGRIAIASPVLVNNIAVGVISQAVPKIRFDSKIEKNIRQAILKASAELSHKLTIAASAAAS